MAFNTNVPASYECVVDGIKFSGSLPTSALSQFDVYAAMLAYWESKNPATWAVVKAYIVANTKLVEEKTGIELKPEDLNFHQVKVMFNKYLTMASDFFTSPQSQENK